MEYEKEHARYEILKSRLHKLEEIEEKLCGWSLLSPQYWKIERLRTKIYKEINRIINRGYIPPL